MDSIASPNVNIIKEKRIKRCIPWLAALRGRKTCWTPG
jgi:hypothetical protein